MKILGFRAENIKRLRAVEITPDQAVVEITGRNGQGKTSVLDAIWWALDTNKVVQSKPVRDGAESGYVTLDLGEYIVTKKFRLREDGEVAISLTVSNRDGAKYGSPTELLKGFFGAFTFDPLAFAEARPQDQVMALRGLVSGFDFATADEDNKRDYHARTEVNRQVRSLEEQIAAIEVPDDTPDEPVSLADLMADYDRALTHNAKIDAAETERQRTLDTIGTIKSGIAQRSERMRELQRQIEELQEQNRAADGALEGLHEKTRVGIGERMELAPFTERISASEQINRHVALAKSRTGLRAALTAASAESTALTEAIDARKAAAAQAVRDAKLPVQGLELSDSAVMLNGLPLEQASDAEQLRLSIAVAAAMSPKLRIARVRDGSRLDRAAMAELKRYAEENDLQVWAETVESGRETAIVIEDGMVSRMAEAAE